MSDKLLNMPGIPTIGQPKTDPYQDFLREADMKASVLVNWNGDDTLEWSVHARDDLFPEGLPLRLLIQMLMRSAEEIMDAAEKEVSDEEADD